MITAGRSLMDLVGRAWTATSRGATCGVLVALAACGGGGGGTGGGTSASYTLGGTISGLDSNSALVLANGGTTLSVPAGATRFTFPSSLTAGTAYSVTVQSSPTGLNCTVSGGSGTINANVTSVAVTCAAEFYTLSGQVTISGATAASDQGVVLTNTSNGDTYTFTTNATSFTMPTSVAYGNAYAIKVTTQPTGLSCSVTNGSGTMPANDVMNIQVACGAGTEWVLQSFGATGDGSAPYGSLIQGTDGDLYGLTRDGGAHGQGTVFKITPAGVETVLYSFGSSTNDGANPYGSLIQASDGNLYGMTVAGGALSQGTVFKITTAGVETVLHSFGAPGDGANPYGGLIQAKDGNLYGMTEGGGSGNGTVFKITTAGVETVLHSFGASGDGNFPYGHLIQATDGNLYGMTQLGGANSLGTVFKITTAGAENVLHSFGASGDGSEPYGSLVQAGDGNLYGTTAVGGTNGLGTVFRIMTGSAETVLHSFGASGDGAKPYGSLLQASDGKLYGMTQIGGANSLGAVFQITTDGTEAVLYSFGSSTPDGSSPQGSLLQASNGALYGLTVQGGTSNVGVVFEIN